MIGRRELVIAVLSAALVGSALGLVVGVVITRATLGIGPGSWGRGQGAERSHAGPRRDGRRGPTMRSLVERLDLSPAQAARIDSILDRSRERYEATRESTRAAVEAELTPKQRERWGEMQQRFRRVRPPAGPP